MRKLCGELIAGLPPDIPGTPGALIGALCATMSRRRGRPVNHRMAAFPPGTASGLWLDMADQDLIVIEERTAPDHQLVILGHELWHMTAGHSTRHVDTAGAGVAARLLAGGVDLQDTVRRVAARSRSHAVEEEEAESFGLLLASKCRSRTAGPAGRGHAPRDELTARIEASLGYRRPQG
ncbi:toxin-antitoxin system, toxin component [Streptomyces uncialis]|uniref:toxin-antitoxin system, toxin component n=1 Tax=Streptomyces uncialis TaxID=1048205 RepID=UPI0033E03C34